MKNNKPTPTQPQISSPGMLFSLRCRSFMKLGFITTGCILIILSIGRYLFKVFTVDQILFLSQLDTQEVLVVSVLIIISIYFLSRYIFRAVTGMALRSNLSVSEKTDYYFRASKTAYLLSAVMAGIWSLIYMFSGDWIAGFCVLAIILIAYSYKPNLAKAIKHLELSDDEASLLQINSV